MLMGIAELLEVICHTSSMVSDMKTACVLSSELLHDTNVKVRYNIILVRYC